MLRSDTTARLWCRVWTIAVHIEAPEPVLLWLDDRFMRACLLGRIDG